MGTRMKTLYIFGDTDSELATPVRVSASSDPHGSGNAIGSGPFGDPITPRDCYSVYWDELLTAPVVINP